MAKRTTRHEEEVQDSATPEVAAASLQSAENSAIVASVDDGNVVLDTANIDTEPVTNSEGKVTAEAAAARNVALLAQGKEPIVDDVEGEDLEARPEANVSEVLPEDTGAEDTVAVRQSNVDRLVDGEVQRAGE